MSEPVRRGYLATSIAALHGLHTDGALPAGSYAALVSPSGDEQDEYDTLHAAGEVARERFGDYVVVTADLEAADLARGGAVPASAVASIHVGADLAWFATQELAALIS